VAQLPSGTVAFLFTDLEGSTRLWEEQPDAMRSALALHDALLREAIAAQGGHLVKSTGDGTFAVFTNAHEGVGAAVAAQLALAGADWPEGVVLRVRMGIHAGSATAQDGDYLGPTVNRTARLMSVAHGGQIVCSQTVAELVGDRFPLVDLGEHRLRDLQSSVHVFQVAAPGLASEFPPLRSLDSLPSNLPRQVTTFVGRETEIASIAKLIREKPLVTLTGVGGVGKTRLALQVAADVVTDFPNGAWLCEFAPVANPDAVWETLAASLRVQAQPGRSVDDAVLDYLATKRLLLVLDNCEHLLDAIAHQVTAITQRCAGVAILATSREGLALAGERLVAVPSLNVPAEGSDAAALMDADAVQLFEDRAHAANNEFAITDRNAGVVGVLCRRLDGIPLAIELAAARVRSLSPDDLVARLDQRFNFLTRGSRAALERHQTLRSTIDWSYDLLAPMERRALDRLSVFAGGCDLGAAEAVLAGDDIDELDVVDLLGQLVDKSLVVADRNADGGVRYRLFESIRQYAQERLEADGESVAVRRRHAEHYVELAQTAGPHLRSRDQLAWMKVVAPEIDNFRAAFDWAVETQSADHAFRLIAPFMLAMAIGDTARDWAVTAITIPAGEQHPLFPTVAAWAASEATFRGDFERAEERTLAAERAQEALGVRLPAIANSRAVLAFYRGDIDQVVPHAEEWAELARASGDDYELALALLLHATACLSDPDVGMPMIEASVRVARDAGIFSALSISLPFLAGMLPIEESERALALLDEAIEVGRLVDNRWGVSQITLAKGAIALQRGEWKRALQLALEYVDQGTSNVLVDPFAQAGVALCRLGCFEPAAVLLAKADALSSARNWPDWALALLAATDAALVEALGREQVATLVARAAALENDAVVAYLRAQATSVLRAAPSAPE
jgi:predicted ATPase/class 3 adenylate cyclase